MLGLNVEASKPPKETGTIAFPSAVSSTRHIYRFPLQTIDIKTFAANSTTEEVTFAILKPVTISFSDKKKFYITSPDQKLIATAWKPLAVSLTSSVNVKFATSTGIYSGRTSKDEVEYEIKSSVNLSKLAANYQIFDKRTVINGTNVVVPDKPFIEISSEGAFTNKWNIYSISYPSGTEAKTKCWLYETNMWDKSVKVSKAEGHSEDECELKGVDTFWTLVMTGILQLHTD